MRPRYINRSRKRFRVHREILFRILPTRAHTASETSNAREQWPIARPICAAFISRIIIFSQKYISRVYIPTFFDT